MTRHWLGLRLPWQHNSSSERGIYYTARVPYVRERLPWLQSKRLVTAAIYRNEHLLELYDTDSPDSDIAGMHPFCSFYAASLSLLDMQEFVFGWNNIEALHNGMTGVDLAEYHRDDFSANSFLTYWRPKQVAGWWIIQRPGHGVAIIREYSCMADRATHAVEISACGLSIFKRDLYISSALADKDRLVCLPIGYADIDWLLQHFETDDAVDVRLAMRFYRKTIFELSVAHEQSPF